MSVGPCFPFLYSRNRENGRQDFDGLLNIQTGPRWSIHLES